MPNLKKWLVKAGTGYANIIDAAGDGNLKAVQRLIAAGYNVNRRSSEDGNTALLAALTRSYFIRRTDNIVSQLLEAGADVNQARADGATPLMIALVQGETEIAAQLLAVEDIDVNQAPTNGYYAGRTPLYMAVDKGHTKIAAQLLEAGADVNQADQNGWTALHIAAQEGHDEFALKLIEKATRETINKKNDKGDTALTLALKKGHLPIVESLIDHDADQGIAIAKGMIPLMLAIREGHYEFALKLIEKTTTATINMQNPDGDTALTLALKKGHLSIAESLISHDADQGIADAKGMTPLMLAINNGYTEFAVELIKTSDTETLNKVNSDGYSALILACSKNNECILSALLQRTDLELNPSNCKHTPLIHASLHQNIALVNALVEKGVSVNHANKDGVTALHGATSRGHAEIVKQLLAVGADVNQADQNGWTALHIAAQEGHDEFALKLIEKATRETINKKNDKGDTALTLALKKGHLDFVRKLLAHGADESLVSDMSEYKKYKKIEGLIQYIEDNSANEITCPISFSSLAVNGSFVDDDNSTSPAVSSGFGKAIYQEAGLKNWIAEKKSSAQDPLTKDNISSKTIIDISRDIAAYFAPLITEVIDTINDLSDEEITDLSLIKPEKEGDEWLVCCQGECSDNILYIPLSQIPIHEFSALRNKLADLKKGHVQELEIAQQRQQSILDHDVPVLADTADGYVEEKGYNPSGMDAEHKEMLGTKGEDMQVPRHKILSQGLSVVNAQSQSMVKTVESARAAEEKDGIER